MFGSNLALAIAFVVGPELITDAAAIVAPYQPHSQLLNFTSSFFLLNQRPRFKVKKLTRKKSLQGPTFITKSAEKISNYS